MRGRGRGQHYFAVNVVVRAKEDPLRLTAMRVIRMLLLFHRPLGRLRYRELRMSYIAASVVLGVSLDTLTRLSMWGIVIGVVGAWIGLGALIWQTAVSRTAANAAKASADAAISAERAWIMVDLERVPGVGRILHNTTIEHGGPERHSVAARIRCVCTNQGKTPAKILEKRAALILVTADNPLPLEPNLEISLEDAAPHYLQSRDGCKREWTLYADGIEEIGATPVVYGVVKYTHLFSDQEFYSTFGYRITESGEYERLSGYPKYNANA
jgi:hypothetical protein